MGVQTEYEKKSNSYKDLETEAKHTLEIALTNNDLRVHGVTSRIKTLQSVFGKIDRLSTGGTVASEQSSHNAALDAIKDIVGLRIVCLFRSQLEHIEYLLRNSFDVLETDRKTENTAVDHFGYMSEADSGVRYAACDRQNANLSEPGRVDSEGVGS